MHKRFLIGKNHGVRIDIGKYYFAINVGKLYNWLEFQIRIYPKPVDWYVYDLGWNKIDHQETGTKRRFHVTKHSMLWFSHEKRN